MHLSLEKKLSSLDEIPKIHGSATVAKLMSFFHFIKFIYSPLILFVKFLLRLVFKFEI
jgi:hypothetical protein